MKLVHAALLVLLASFAAYGQYPTAGRIVSGAAVPTHNCNPGPPRTDIYIRTGVVPHTVYICSTAPNGWTLVSGSGGGITNSAGANVIMKSDGTNAVPSGIEDAGGTITVGGGAANVIVTQTEISVLGDSALHLRGGTIDINADLVPTGPGGANLGATSLPFGGVFIGTGINQTIQLVGTSTANRTATFPDATTRIPIASQFLTFTGPTAARTFTFPDANATILTTNALVTETQGGTGLGAPGDDQVLVGNGTIYQFKTLPSCSDGITSKLLYNNSTNTFSCGTDQTSGGGGGITSLNTLTGATQTFSKTDDTNVTLTLTPSGTDHNFAIGWAGTLAAGRLNGNVVQAVTNDTNVTGSISSQNLTLGWTGTLAKARQHAATVYNDAGNTYSTGAQNFSSATSLTLPVAAGAGPTANGTAAYDSTDNDLEYGDNGTNRKVANLNEAQTFSNKSISGASNTLSDIGNSSLTNSSVTIGSTSVSLGGTAGTVAGLTLTTPTIGSFANANHDHTNSAGGGQLNATNVFSAGTVPTARLGSGTANSTTFLRGDSTWASPAGSGDVVGPSSATDNAVVRFDSTTGKLVQNSVVTIADTTGNLETPGTISTGVGGSDAGFIGLTQGTAQSIVANTVGLMAPTSVTGYNIVYPSAAASGIPHLSNSSNVVTMTISGIAIADFTATGTPSATTFLRGDNTWATPSGSGSPGGSDTQVQRNNAGAFGGISGFTSDGTNVTAGSGNLTATRPKFITSIDDTNANEVFKITATASAVNEFTVTNSATGNGVSIAATGGDTDIDATFTSKGAGLTKLGTLAAGGNSLGIGDSNGSHYLNITPTSNLTADRALNLATGDAARTVTINGNPTLDDWFDQSVKTTANPQFATVEVGAASDTTLARSGAGVLTVEGVTVARTIAFGTSALGTSAIASGACATVVTTTATGTATTDTFAWVFNADPTSTTGYQASTNGMLTIIAYPTTNNVNFKVCNNTSSSITPGAVTLNWRVAR